MKKLIEMDMQISAETADRFSLAAKELCLSRIQTIAYLTRLYVLATPGSMDKRPKRTYNKSLHAKVLPETKAVLDELRVKYNMNRDQAVAALLDLHESRPSASGEAIRYALEHHPPTHARKTGRQPCKWYANRIPGKQAPMPDCIKNEVAAIRNAFRAVMSGDSEAPGDDEREEAAAAKAAYENALRNAIRLLQEPI